MACKTITIDGLAYELTPLGPVKDYEILSFKDTYGTVITWQGEDAHGGYNYKQWSEASLAFDYKIHSVKRTYDNEIFELNKTRVKDPNTNHEWVISEITLREDKIYFNGVWMNHVQKVNEPIPDHEILSYIVDWLGQKDVIFEYHGRGWKATNSLHTDVAAYESDAALKSHAKIHSVKRLADNEIFTIGDRIDDTHYGYANQIISEFEIKESKILVRYWNGSCYLENIKKPKLMTTLTINQKTIEELTKMRSDINKLWPEHFKDMGFIPVAIAVSQLNGFSRIQKEIDRLIEILKDDPNDKTRTD